MISFLCFCFGHGLAEGDRRRFEWTFAIVAIGDPHSFLYSFLDLLPVISLSAVQASDIHGSPVKLDHPSFRVSGLEVKAIDVLSNDTVKLTQSLHLANGEVSRAGRGFFHRFIHLGCHLPVFFPCRFTGKKLLEVEVSGIVPIPDPSGATKVWNA